MANRERHARGTDLDRHNQATRRLYDNKFPDNWEFRGVDGEGGNVPEEGTLFGLRHQYLSLRIGPELLETGKPLHWTECLDFIAAQPHRYLYVSYFFDYDVTMIVRTMPKEAVNKLLNRKLRIKKFKNNITLLPLEIGDFLIEYTPHKEFKVRRKDQKHWVIISDVGSFFQSSFLNTLKKWNVGTEEEQEMIRKGKSMRSDFAETSEEIKAYNALECLLLEQVMSNFRAVCWETGYVPKKWQGPGYLASAMLEKHGVPRRDDIPILSNDHFRALAQAAYYGGRFETTSAGPVPGPVYQYDINSAYPSALKSLPCLIHGTWTQVREEPADGIYFGRVAFTHSAPRTLYNLPFRSDKGNIYFPREGIGVYWSVELGAARSAGTEYSFLGGWKYHSNCDCRWFDFIDAYYAQRIALGKSSKGYVLKLAGNSIYGKLAQSIGYAPYANPVWAGLITATCRSLLIQAYSQAPDDCHMLATDGLFMTKPLDLPISNKLGEWEETIHPDGIFIVQPGVYFIGDEAKSRGVERGRIHAMREMFNEQWQKYLASHGVDHTVSVPVDNFITAKQALQRGKWELAGTWVKMERDISFDWSLKRKRGLAFHRSGTLRTVPPDGKPDKESTPYSRQIGGGDDIYDGGDDRYSDPGLLEADRMSQQPDWVDPLF